MIPFKVSSTFKVNINLCYKFIGHTRYDTLPAFQSHGGVRTAGYSEEVAAPQAPPVALTRAIGLRDCALRYEPPPRDAASASLTDASPVAAALLVGCMDTRIEPADPVRPPAACLPLVTDSAV